MNKKRSKKMKTRSLETATIKKPTKEKSQRTGNAGYVIEEDKHR